MPFAPKLRLGLGQYPNPQFYNNYTPTLYRNPTEHYAGVEGEYNETDDNYAGRPNGIALGLPWELGYSDDSWVLDSGMELYNEDGTKAFKNLLWQHMVQSVTGDELTSDNMTIVLRTRIAVFDIQRQSYTEICNFTNSYGGARYTSNLSMYYGVFTGTYNDQTYYACAYGGDWTRTYNQDEACKISGPGITIKWFIDNGYQPPDEIDDPNDEGDDSGEGGGDGDHDPTPDPVPIPGLPPVGAADAGFITAFKLSLVEMKVFAHEMMSADIWAAIKAFFSDPMDFICGIIMLPFSPPATYMRRPVFGTNRWTSMYTVLDNQFAEIDCGNLEIPKYYGSAFDYEPYTKIKIYLPFIGYQDLKADEVMGSTINVKYHIDCMTGDCLAIVTDLNTIGTGVMFPQVIGQYSGTCGVRVPYGRVSYDAAIQAGISLIGAAATMGVGAAVGGLGLAASATELTAGQVANQLSAAGMTAVSGSKVGVVKSGTLGASAAFMGVMTPHVIRYVPRQSLPANYRHLCGYPSNISGTLSSFSGFTAVETIQLSGIGATQEEKDEILSILKGGVLV